MTTPYSFEKEHTKSCNENADVQAVKFDKIAKESFAKMQAKGIDTSMRGIGFQYECICKTQENSE
jgi:hypothetical protein